MGKKKAERISLDGEGVGSGGLTHNPFAALGGALPPKAAAGEVSEGGAGKDVAPPSDGGDAWGLRGAALVVRHERKGHGGKTVTVIDGSRAAETTRAGRWEALAKELRKALGVGARASGSEVTLQGDLVDRVSGLLEDRFGAKVTRGTRP